MSSHSDSGESSSHQSQSQSLRDNDIPVRASSDSEDSYSPPFIISCRSHEDSNRPGVLEALPLLRRPNIHIDRTKNNVSLRTGRGPTYGSDDGGSIHGNDGEPLVRVQSGVKKVEAITMLWTRKSLIVAYVRSITV